MEYINTFSRINALVTLKHYYDEYGTKPFYARDLGLNGGEINGLSAIGPLELSYWDYLINNNIIKNRAEYWDYIDKHGLRKHLIYKTGKTETTLIEIEEDFSKESTIYEWTINENLMKAVDYFLNTFNDCLHKSYPLITLSFS